MKRIAYYTCDECGKRFETEKEALACEARHAEERARAKWLKDEKKTRREKIKADFKELMKEVEAYNRDYKEAVELPYTGALNKLFDTFFNDPWIF